MPGRPSDDSKPPGGDAASKKAVDTRIIDASGHDASSSGLAGNAQRYPAMSRLQQLPLKLPQVR